MSEMNFLATAEQLKYVAFGLNYKDGYEKLYFENLSGNEIYRLVISETKMHLSLIKENTS